MTGEETDVVPFFSEMDGCDGLHGIVELFECNAAGWESAEVIQMLLGTIWGRAEGAACFGMGTSCNRDGVYVIGEVVAWEWVEG